jgi:alpha-ribazole phosphatase
VFLIRHGQTLWNCHARYQGHTDVELGESGRLQARLLSERLATQPLKAVYASDLRRALETAEIIAAPHNLRVELLSQLREINFGAWEGLTYQEIRERFGDLVDRWHAAPGDVPIPDGEVFQELKDRACAAIAELVRRHESEAIAVVTHGGTIRAIICALLDISMNHLFRIRQDNAALNIIDFYDNFAVLSLLNDTHHLECEK